MRCVSLQRQPPAWGSLLEIAISGERVGVRIRGDADKVDNMFERAEPIALLRFMRREDARRVLEATQASCDVSAESLVDAVALSVNLCVPWQ